LEDFTEESIVNRAQKISKLEECGVMANFNVAFKNEEHF